MKQYIYVVVRKNSKKMSMESWELKKVDNATWPTLRTFLSFRTRETAMRWVDYWREGRKDYKVLCVSVSLDPLGELIK